MKLLFIVLPQTLGFVSTLAYIDTLCRRTGTELFIYMRQDISAHQQMIPEKITWLVFPHHIVIYSNGVFKEYLHKPTA